MKRRTSRKANIGTEQSLEPRIVMAATPMQVGMNLDNVRDYLPNSMFNNVFEQSRPWISHSYNTVTRQFSFNGSVPVATDANGWPTQLASWTNASGQLMQQRIGTLMFRELNGQYPGGEYRAEWEGTGDVVFGFDAGETSRGTLPNGRHYAILNVVPGNAGIYMGINSMNPADPVRGVHVLYQDVILPPTGGSTSPFNQQYKDRLDDFGILRFMQTMETNTSDVRTWSDRRDASAARQVSGTGNSFANGMSVELMVQLANELDADPWFNMPHMADDQFVANFADYVRDNLEPGRTVYVEWSNEVWNGVPGFEAAPWIAEQLRLPENSGLTTWQFVAQQTSRDFNIWRQRFGAQAGRVVRTVGVQAVNPWIAERILENMNGNFDAIAIAPYFGPSQAQRATYTAETTVDQVIADLRGNLPFATQMVLAHQRLADDYSRLLNRDIRLLAYEGGPHLNSTSSVQEDLLYRSTKSPQMAELTRDYLRQINAGGLDAYVHYRFTDVNRPSRYGYFGVLESQNQPIEQAHMYRTLLEANTGTLFTNSPTLVTVSTADPTANEEGRQSAAFRFTRGGNLSQPLTVSYAPSGSATSGSDYTPLVGTVNFPANQNTVYVFVNPIDDAAIESQESLTVTINPGEGYSLIGGTTGTASVNIVSNDFVAGAPTVSIVATDATAFENNRDPGVFTVTRANGDLTRPLTVYLQYGFQTATAADYVTIPLRVDFAAGESSRPIVLIPVDDSTIENTETVILTVNPSSTQHRVGNGRATINIIDNDTPLSTVTIAATDVTASETGRETGTFTVTRTGSTASPLTVSYAIQGTATNGFDYDRLGGNVTIPAGASTTNITIRPIDERVADAGESVSLRIGATPFYSLGSVVEASLTITDNDIANASTPVLIVIANHDFYYQEYADPRLALEAAGVPVVVAAGVRTLSVPHLNTGYGVGNGAVMPDIALAAANASQYSAIVFVGGWGASSYQFAFPGTYANAAYNSTPTIRSTVNSLINAFVAQDKYVTGVCHGVSVLSWSRVNGQSLVSNRVVTTAQFSSPTNTIPGATTYRWHSEINGATVYTGGVLGDASNRFDDVVVDGRIITAENFDSAALFGRTVAAYVINGAATTTLRVSSLDTVASESAGDSATIQIHRTGLLDHAQVVRFQTSGSSTAGIDYQSLGNRVLFQPRQTTATLNVIPINDSDEDDEDLFFELLGDPSYSLDPLKSVLVSILANE